MTTGPWSFYLTTPIYYVNAAPHLGHASATIMADTMCRYRRLAGDRVYFLTGTDEHGDKVAQAAARAGETPQAYADRIAAAFRDTWRRLGISQDDFIRTTEPRHVHVVQQVLAKLWDAGEIYFGEYGGPYCFGCERFYTDKEIVEGKCPDHQTPLTYIREKNYFFRMSRYQDWLIDHLRAHPDFIQPERYRNEVLGFLREPLQDLSISRPTTRLEWGIPLPFDPKYVTYVWFDALLNYISALGYPDGPLYREFWETGHGEHLIGKDILKPHAVYWPCMLHAAGVPLPRRLNVHGFWNLGGGKMSKSVGNVVEALALTDRYGHDAFRYFLLREMPFGLDASFSEEALVGRLNADLANDLGNLVARVTTLVGTARGGVAPGPGPTTDADAEVRTALQRVGAEVALAMEEFAFHRALAALWEVLGVLNRYVDATEPWTLVRRPDAAARLDTVLYTLAEALRGLAILLLPFLPVAAARIREALGQTEPPRLADLGWGRLRSGTRVEKLTGLFPRVDRGRVGGPVASVDAAGDAGAGGAASAGRINIEEFRRFDLRVAEVLDAERVPKSKKLLRLTVKLGDVTRTVVAGIAEHYAPDSLRGRKIVMVANLEPATLLGITSDGMVLAGEDGGTLALLTLDRDLPPGAKVR
jgi:methionyl-tRNA synthetase